jgi:uncharacterized protein YdeI (YjbR/CyaY-like superfamily)
MSSKVSQIPSYQPKTRAEWRKWLATNHAASQGVRLVIVKKNADVAGITYSDAVEEALCFGWIDGVTNSVDGQRYKLYMSPRKPGSVWSKLNKQRIRKLIKDGSMTPVGLAKIETAKKDGSWTQLDAIDKLVMPEDLLEQLSANAEAKRNFEAFSTSSKKIILFWIACAKREETRRKRIAETVRLAAQNIKAAHYQQ